MYERNSTYTWPHRAAHATRRRRSGPRRGNRRHCAGPAIASLARCTLDALAFKGGTSLRKLYAGNAGRFSLDLDFSAVNIGADPDDALTELIAGIEGLNIGPFSYGVTERRGKWTLTFNHDLGDATSDLASKLDLNPPPWLPPIRRGWRPV
ncbi:nucleotidyl transferase AbiEii/AbiGii toxin family protein [Paramicrobacterium chengjingii]|uniref:Nucleotidyl transferase AbiEii/AbiGii toxin family protein n=1 Tax=Paramicrobacterium chengjingii TaxID=2769067 RepID=A0ABX6YF85_9MICO|nr:nucleotidyl transferase AbiEii/AbiGii toxin family protein [Microbacterium chengjingii]